MNETELTIDDLIDLWYLCDREADQFDYDKGVYVRHSELANKIDTLIRVKKEERDGPK